MKYSSNISLKKTDNRLIVLSPNDTVFVARCQIPSGTELMIDGQKITLETSLSMGHKLASRPMSLGDKVLKYGVSIGSATVAIAKGEHVHLHNMKSDYTATYALDQTADVEGIKS